MKRQLGLLERMDLMDEVAPRQPLVEVCGDRRVLIENHRGVREYGLEKVSVRVRFGNIVVSGQGLKLSRMSAQHIVISGKIGSVILERTVKP